MNEKDAENLKEQLLKIWENNAVFRDNIALLTQVSLRFPQQLILSILERVEDSYYYESLEVPPYTVFLHT